MKYTVQHGVKKSPIPILFIPEDLKNNTEVLDLFSKHANYILHKDSTYSVIDSGSLARALSMLTPTELGLIATFNSLFYLRRDLSGLILDRKFMNNFLGNVDDFQVVLPSLTEALREVLPLDVEVIEHMNSKYVVVDKYTMTLLSSNGDIPDTIYGELLEQILNRLLPTVRDNELYRYLLLRQFNAYLAMNR